MSESSNQQDDSAPAAYDRASRDAKRVWEKRHAKYGTGNIAAFGLLGCIVRASDKLARLKQSVVDGHEADDESVLDALIDLTNYGIMGIACHRREWPGTEKRESV